MKRLVILAITVMMALPQMAQNHRRHSSSRQYKTSHQIPQKQKGKGKGAAAYTTNEIRGLQSQRQQIEKDIRDQQNKLRANKQDVEQRLNNLMVLNGEIDAKQKDIEGVEEESAEINL